MSTEPTEKQLLACTSCGGSGCQKEWECRVSYHWRHCKDCQGTGKREYDKPVYV